MTALVVYESMWGATKVVAEAIGEGLGGDARVVEVGALAAEAGEGLPADLDLLVVGGPTHAFGMTKPNTRADAARRKSPVLSATIGVREWLESLTLPAGVACAAFDTKIATPNLPGSAAKGIDKRLRKLGGKGVAKARTFRVHGKTNELVDGEIDGARAWGTELAAATSG